MSGNLFSRFRASVVDEAQNFLRTPDGRSFSYVEAFAASARLANVLAELGVFPGARVAVQVEKSPEAILLYLACLSLGAIYLPLNTAYTLAELKYFLSDSLPKVFVVSPQKEAAVAPLASRLKFGRVETLGSDGTSGSLLEKARTAAATFADAELKGDALAAILYTSGTTGRSKGAMLSHDNLGANAYTLKDLWRFTAADVLLHALPVFHVHGLFVATNTILAAGASMLFLPKFDPDTVFRALPDASVMMGVPTFYVRLLQDRRLTRAATRHMRLFISGSAPLLADTHREFRERTGHAILERYGMTETGMLTSNPYDGDRVPGSVGFPLPDVSLRIAHPETGAPIKQGEIGMIEVKGPNVFSGYWGMPEKTKTEFRGGHFITGDLGRIDSRGYVHIVGRGKDLIISGGFNVYPKEVEEEIDALEGVVESAVIGVPHRDFGEGVTAVVVKQKGASLSEATVLAALRLRLAGFKLPKKVIFLDDLPRNTMGKVQKALLRETYKDLYGAGIETTSRD
jgi:malonyl-CoA/methylmalonyl-CoA synthetase